MNVQSFEDSLKRCLQRHLKDGHLTVASAVLIACNAVEEASRALKDPKLKGVEKRKWASVLIPNVISESVHEGYISREEGDRLESELNACASIINGLIDAYVFISNQPHMLQIGAQLKTRCSACVGKRRA